MRETDTVARLGGDEFVILLTNVVDCASVDRTTRLILSRFKQPIHLDGIRLSVGTSIGIAVFPDGGRDSADLLANADKAMYEAKRQGKGMYCHFPTGDGISRPETAWPRAERVPCEQAGMTPGS